MSLSTAYTLLDAFVIPRPYIVAVQNQSKDPKAVIIDEKEDLDSVNITATQEPDNAVVSTSNSFPVVNQTDPITSDYSYIDDHISINIEKVSENSVEFYVADIQIKDISYLKTAFAYDTYGKNITQTTSQMAEANDAIFAINGDYYGFRDTGLVIRNSQLYRDVFSKNTFDQSLIIDRNGNFEIMDGGQISGTSLIDAGVLQGFTFGPVLVENGQMASFDDSRISNNTNPRTAIGQISALHYIFIVVDGRTSISKGLTLKQLAQEFTDRGATIAYNLDGGGSSAMWLNGELINNPTDGKRSGERKISDIIFIGY
jgi:exopolysaccharide biosynthesis protein